MVKLFHNLENFFQTYIEGFFDKKFSSGLQPVEIAKQIVRVMEDSRYVGVKRVYVPNHFTVHLSGKDFERLSPYWEAICEELKEFIRKQTIERNYTIIGKPILDVYSDDSLKSGKFSVAADFSEPLPGEEEKVDAEGTGPQKELSDTRVFQKTDAPILPTVRFCGMLTVIEGIDAGLKADVGYNRVNIGRRDGNEMVLADMNTSRLHAYIVYEEGGHVLYDAKSLNGTYINAHRVTRKRLSGGDRIKLGNTVILYEVK